MSAQMQRVGGLDVVIDMCGQRDRLNHNIRFLCEAFGWEQLAGAGLRCEALVRCRSEMNIGILEAKRMVDEYMALVAEGLA